MQLTVRQQLLRFAHVLQTELFPMVERETVPLTEDHRRIIAVLEVIPAQDAPTAGPAQGRSSDVDHLRLERWFGNPARRDFPRFCCLRPCTCPSSYTRHWSGKPSAGRIIGHIAPGFTDIEAREAFPGPLSRKRAPREPVKLLTIGLVWSRALDEFLALSEVPAGAVRRSRKKEGPPGPLTKPAQRILRECCRAVRRSTTNYFALVLQ